MFILTSIRISTFLMTKMQLLLSFLYYLLLLFCHLQLNDCWFLYCDLVLLVSQLTRKHSVVIATVKIQSFSLVRLYEMVIKI